MDEGNLAQWFGPRRLGLLAVTHYRRRARSHTVTRSSTPPVAIRLASGEKATQRASWSTWSVAVSRRSTTSQSWMIPGVCAVISVRPSGENPRAWIHPSSPRKVAGSPGVVVSPIWIPLLTPPDTRSDPSGEKARHRTGPPWVRPGPLPIPPVGHVPELHQALGTRRGQSSPAGGEIDGADRVAVTEQSGPRFSRCDLPKPDTAIGAPGRQGRPIRREGERVNRARLAQRDPAQGCLSPRPDGA